MTVTQADITIEVREFIDQAIAQKEPISADWISAKILSSHQDLFGEDKDYYLLCGNYHVRKTVQSALRLYRDDPTREIPEQLRLEGWEHLQKVYLVDSRGEQIITPIELCSDADLREKIREYRKMAAGCLAHANELERYRMARFGGIAA